MVRVAMVNGLLDRLFPQEVGFGTEKLVPEVMKVVLPI